MTFTISKTKLAIAIIAVAMIIPSSAMAFHVFDDVPDDKFYAEPVEWAFDNGITTGKSPTMFAPDDGVTRGESVTFLKRYNDNVVEPAIETLQADRSIVAFESEGDAVDDWDGSTETIDATLTAPSAGYAIVTYSAALARDCDETGSGTVRITAAIDADGVKIGETWDHIDIDGAPNCLAPETWNDTTLSMTRVVAVSEGANVFDVEISHTGSGTRMLYIYEHTLSATFVPVGQPSNDTIIIVPLGEGAEVGQGQGG